MSSSAAVCFFPTIDAAVPTAIHIIPVGVPTTRLAEIINASVAEAEERGLADYMAF